MRFTNSSFGLTLGPFAHRSSAFTGTLWTTGATCTSTRMTAVGASGSTPPWSRNREPGRCGLEQLYE